MTPLWNVTVLTILPEAYPGPLQQSLAGKALSQNLWTLCVVDIRSFAEDKHKTVDDKPFGGGVGMVMLPTVVGAALDHVIASKPQAKLLYLTPRGKLLNQKKIQSLIKQDVIILSGRFEGLDQRVIDKYNLEEVSIGDYVLSGGDIAALVLIDAGVRLLPGVTNNEVAKQESFGTEGPYESLLEYPQYTKPAVWQGLAVPDILLSGHHQKIAAWKLEQAEQLTKQRRTDLWQNYLANYKKNYKND